MMRISPAMVGLSALAIIGIGSGNWIAAVVGAILVTLIDEHYWKEELRVQAK